jgi:hypothetical protein
VLPPHGTPTGGMAAWLTRTMYTTEYLANVISDNEDSRFFLQRKSVQRYPCNSYKDKEPDSRDRQAGVRSLNIYTWIRGKVWPLT